MRGTPRILIADDNPTNVDILRARLATQGYEILTASDGQEALEMALRHRPDLLLLDVQMPKLDGIEVCRQLKADGSLPFMPIIMVTARADTADVVAGLEAGADEYLTKPVDQAALVARVKSMLRIKGLHDTVQEQAQRLEGQSAELAQWNQALEQRVTEQVAELEQVGRLKRFLSPQLAELVVSSGDAAVLQTHRREIAVVFCDLRGFTAFAETAEPEEVMAVLHEYHYAVGALVFQHEGTVGHFAGDGIMMIFNDPVPCAEPAGQAVRMAVAMRGQVGDVLSRWRRHGHDLGFGVGIALGYATLGIIGFEGRSDYGVIGSSVNLAARLCGEAADGQILVSQRVSVDVEALANTEPVGDLTLKGFHRPVPAFNILGLLEPE